MNATLVRNPSFNADGELTAWAFLPNETWRSIAPLLARTCDLVGFSYYKLETELSESGLFDVLEATPLKSVRETVDGHDYHLLLCQFTAHTAYLMGTTNFNHWSSTDGDLNVDEIFFFQADQRIAIVKPREGLAEFYGADIGFLQDIENSHPSFKDSVFIVEDGKFSGTPF